MRRVKGRYQFYIAVVEKKNPRVLQVCWKHTLTQYDTRFVRSVYRDENGVAYVKRAIYFTTRLNRIGVGKTKG